jgi:hypothetical protein
MQTPHRMTLAEFREAMKQFLSVCCLQRDRTLVCPECESRIAYRRTSVSIHDSSFGDRCVSSNWWTWSLCLPYCPRCEERPDAHGCLHLPITQFSRAS